MLRTFHCLNWVRHGHANKLNCGICSHGGFWSYNRDLPALCTEDIGLSRDAGVAPQVLGRDYANRSLLIQEGAVTGWWNTLRTMAHAHGMLQFSRCTAEVATENCRAWQHDSEIL